MAGMEFEGSSYIHGKPRAEPMLGIEAIDALAKSFGKLARVKGVPRWAVSSGLLRRTDGMVEISPESPLAVPVLAQVEAARRIHFLRNSYGYYPPMLAKVDSELAGMPDVRFAAIRKPFSSSVGFKMHLVVCVHDRVRLKPLFGRLHRTLEDIGSQHNTKIHLLLLDSQSFVKLAVARTANPIRETLADGFALVNPNAYWTALVGAAAAGRSVSADAPYPNLRAISDKEVIRYNMVRFGYNELGIRHTPDTPLDIESTVVALLGSAEPRRREIGASVTLLKNPVNAHYLTYLADAFGLADNLFSVVSTIQAEGLATPSVGDAGDLLESVGARARRFDTLDDKKKKVYHLV